MINLKLTTESGGHSPQASKMPTEGGIRNWLYYDIFTINKVKLCLLFWGGMSFLWTPKCSSMPPVGTPSMAYI